MSVSSDANCLVQIDQNLRTRVTNEIPLKTERMFSPRSREEREDVKYNQQYKGF